MADWPLTVPGPQVGWETSVGNNVLIRKLQSGRVGMTRYGSGAADQCSCTFRFTTEQKELFDQFYRQTLNFGVNWFAAWWLNSMGYEQHKAKIAGYVPVSGAPPGRSDYQVVLHIKNESACPPDTTWPKGE